MGERLKLCQPSLDLPEWWECGKHDKDLLIGAAKHGVSRTDYHILNDPELSFLEAHKNFAQNRGTGNANTVSSLNPLGAGCSQTPPIVPSTPVQEEKTTEQTESKVEGSENPAAKEKSDIKEETEVADKDTKQDCDAEAEPGSVKCELKDIETSTDVDPKSISEKGSEEDEEEKLDDDDKSEESSQPEGNSLIRSTLCAYHEPHSCSNLGKLISSMQGVILELGLGYMLAVLPFHVSGGLISFQKAIQHQWGFLPQGKISKIAY